MWTPQYEMFSLAPKSLINYGEEYEKYKLNFAFNYINEIIEIDKNFYKQYGNMHISDIPKNAIFERGINTEKAVIELGRILNGVMFRTWRIKYLSKFTMIKKLYKELRKNSMNYILSCNHWKAEKIGRIINNPLEL